MWYFTIFQDKLHSVNIQDDQSWALSETVPKISKILVITFSYNDVYSYKAFDTRDIF